MGNLFSCCINRQKSIEYPKPTLLNLEEGEDYFFFNEDENRLDTIFDNGSIDI